MSAKMVDGEWKVDRTHWPPGPWNDEPDREEWKTKTGLPGLIVRNGLGGLCGYVAVPPGHPLHGKDYDAPDVRVHGGLTFAAGCREDGPICHKPAPGEPDNVWWFGFDCVHSGDWAPPSYPPGLLGSRDRALPAPAGSPWPADVYRDLAYVRAEVESLAGQLSAVTPMPSKNEEKKP